MTKDALYGYRLVKKKWAEAAFDGEGAKRYGGRWNSRGRRCVYLASSESLAILEVMVHLEDFRVLAHYALFRLDLSGVTMMQLSEKALPTNWRENPAAPETATVGDEWLSTRSSVALAVPSAVVPRELNYLLNPEHAHYGDVISTAQALSFSLDARLLAR